MRDFKDTIIHVLLPIIIGTAIYVLLRGYSGLFQSEKFIDKLSGRNIDGIQYNLPDGLWLYGLLSMITILWRKIISVYFVIWIFTAMSAAYFSEILQGLKIIPGTFDWLDILAYTAAILVYGIVNYKVIKNHFKL